MRDPPERNTTCCVESHGDGIPDDSCYIMSALHKCNSGGHVLFKEDMAYIVGKALDLTFLSMSILRQISRGQFCSPTTPVTGRPTTSRLVSRTSPCRG